MDRIRMMMMKALDFLSNEGLGIDLIDEDEGGLRQPPGPRSGGLRPEDPPAGGLRPGPDRIPSSRSGSCSRHRSMIPKCDRYISCSATRVEQIAESKLFACGI